MPFETYLNELMKNLEALLPSPLLLGRHSLSLPPPHPYPIPNAECIAGLICNSLGLCSFILPANLIDGFISVIYSESVAACLRGLSGSSCTDF